MELLNSTDLNLKAMRSLFANMSQGINHSRTLTRVEDALLRYGQLIIYFFAIAIIGVIYMGAQKAMANYLESLQALQVSQF